MDDWDDFSGSLFGDARDEDADPPPARRANCPDCLRPSSVCWCPYVPDPPVRLERSRFLVLQHPNEEKRAVRTAHMAARGLAEQACTVVVGRKFPGSHGVVEEALSSGDAFLLFPGERSEDIGRVVEEARGRRKTFVILDGTWDEARKLYARNPALRSLRQVRLSTGGRSAYVVRTQPADGCLSTVETVAHAAAEAEGRPELAEALTAPLHALCNFQINHGAVGHDSREFKGQNGRFVKKSNFKKKDVSRSCK